MGYTTEFEGVLEFTKELTIPQLAMLQTFMGEDVREHPEWLKKKGADYSYIQFEVTKDYKGIKWDGGEKFYCVVEAVNLILINMRKQFPDFGLKGKLLAQGEDIRDRWELVIKDGRAIKLNVKIEGSIYRCPHCGEKVVTSEAEKIQ